MKTTRRICIAGLMLIMNWMMHGEMLAVMYFSAVMIGGLYYYCGIKLEKIFESALIRFVLMLSICLCFSIEAGWMEALSWLMICAASSAFTQIVQKSDLNFLNRLSVMNMILMPVLLVVIVFCMQKSSAAVFVLMMISALFQPSGLPLANPLDSFEMRKTSI